jgi:hypothetical protein
MRFRRFPSRDHAERECSRQSGACPAYRFRPYHDGKFWRVAIHCRINDAYLGRLAV